MAVVELITADVVMVGLIIEVITIISIISIMAMTMIISLSNMAHHVHYAVAITTPPNTALRENMTFTA